MHTTPRFFFAALITTILLSGMASARASTGTSAITGSVFQDTNRNGVQDAGEAPESGMYLDLTSGGSMLAMAATDASGRYSFANLNDGTYRVQIDSMSWNSMRNSWVPTTTGSLYPLVDLTLSGTATTNFGLRQILRSGGTPISTFTGPQGLVVQSFDDAVSAQQVYNDLMLGTEVTTEAQDTTVNFDDGSLNDTTTSVAGDPGAYTSYHATVHMTYTSWLDTGDQLLFHEYGHAWSLYYAYLVRQDDTLTSYLKARGIYGDSRLDTSHAWNRRELIAEDYRQLFGSAGAQAARQENTDLPAASQVPGLKDFLTSTFTQSSTPGPGPSPSPSPSPSGGTTTVLQITGLSVSPAPVKTSASVSFTLSANATVTVTVTDAKGSVVKTLLSSAPKAAGASAVGWDRTNASGRRVKSGTYRVTASATDASGGSATSSVTFTVS